MAQDTKLNQQLLAAASLSAAEQRAAAVATALAERILHIWPSDGPEISDWLLGLAAELDAPLACLAPEFAAPELIEHQSPEPPLGAPSEHHRSHGRRRARTHKGQFQADDPATPHANEAYVEPSSQPASPEPSAD